MSAAVLGGTFAPPTLAHRDMLLGALAASGASDGLFLPAGVGYMARWRDDSAQDTPFMDSKVRLAMLRLMARDDRRLHVCAHDVCMNAPAYTYDTLHALRARYGRVCFVMGADNLRRLPHWHEAARLLDEFDVYVAGRGGFSLGDALSADAFLAAHAARLHVLAPPAACADISAGCVRALALSGRLNEAAGCLHPAVLAYIAAHILPKT